MPDPRRRPRRSPAPAATDAAAPIRRAADGEAHDRRGALLGAEGEQPLIGTVADAMLRDPGHRVPGRERRVRRQDAAARVRQELAAVPADGRPVRAGVRGQRAERARRQPGNRDRGPGERPAPAVAGEAAADAQHRRAPLRQPGAPLGRRMPHERAVRRLARLPGRPHGLFRRVRVRRGTAVNDDDPLVGYARVSSSRCASGYPQFARSRSPPALAASTPPHGASRVSASSSGTTVAFATAAPRSPPEQDSIAWRGTPAQPRNPVPSQNGMARTRRSRRPARDWSGDAGERIGEWQNDHRPHPYALRRRERPAAAAGAGAPLPPARALRARARGTRTHRLGRCTSPFPRPLPRRAPAHPDRRARLPQRARAGARTA